MNVKKLLFLLSFASVFILSACAAPSDTSTDPYGDSTSKPPAMTPPATTETASNPQLAAPVAGEKIATIETDQGTIKVKLFSDRKSVV